MDIVRNMFDLSKLVRDNIISSDVTPYRMITEFSLDYTNMPSCTYDSILNIGTFDDCVVYVSIAKSLRDVECSEVFVDLVDFTIQNHMACYCMTGYCDDITYNHSSLYDLCTPHNKIADILDRFGANTNDELWGLAYDFNMWANSIIILNLLKSNSGSPVDICSSKFSNAFNYIFGEDHNLRDLYRDTFYQSKDARYAMFATTLEYSRLLHEDETSSDNVTINDDIHITYGHQDSTTDEPDVIVRKKFKLEQYADGKLKSMKYGHERRVRSKYGKIKRPKYGWLKEM